MRFAALFATLALLVACGTEPEPPERPRIEAVSLAPFHSQHLLEIKVVDAGSTYMQRLVEHVPVDNRRTIKGETDVWSADGGPRVTDFYLSAPKPARTVGQKLAILADGHVIAAPVINSVISGGRAEVTFDEPL
jgi:preprotein translocase subunit SecD